ncbi:hypothetical protein [Rhizobium sp. RCAM05973]|uniref:hypothetical protein n=1 Tax=Rhizobium sp. RCAM05973 TaxID=2994066 RepID=UPI0022EBB781|nr:hypothetical protein [Rhizobium sp. RCAM05973]
MTHTTVVGLDLAKNVFQVHGIDAEGRKTFNKKLRREEVKEFFANIPLAPLPWKPEAPATSGHERLARWVTKR